MTQKYGKDSSVTALLDKVDFIILPVLNVDGYAYTWIDPVGHGSVVQKSAIFPVYVFLFFLIISRWSRRGGGPMVSVPDSRPSTLR